jgi:ABC-2 type transport system ATP-binding protein
VVIINKCKIVATDSVRNLRSRALGGESVIVELASRDGELETEKVRTTLGNISGVTSVTLKESQDGRHIFEIASEKDFVRGDLARAVVESGWDLNELRPTALSLEEIFLQLTSEQAESKPEEKTA